jgi:hypothetical protein
LIICGSDWSWLDVVRLVVVGLAIVRLVIVRLAIVRLVVVGLAIVRLVVVRLVVVRLVVVRLVVVRLIVVRLIVVRLVVVRSRCGSGIRSKRSIIGRLRSKIGLRRIIPWRRTIVRCGIIVRRPLVRRSTSTLLPIAFDPEGTEKYIEIIVVVSAKFTRIYVAIVTPEKIQAASGTVGVIAGTPSQSISLSIGVSRATGRVFSVEAVIDRFDFPSCNKSRGKGEKNWLFEVHGTVWRSERES